ncbi:MAG TPA: biopolymer transporter ExbD [Alphaproteobacteria bacterium]|nr:biopolymer transporter ExbD [Alphaproteobacteria bacterium]
MRFEAPRQRRRIISLTPLIDVVFILLVFFMLATSFDDWRSISLDPPAAAARGTGMEGAVLVRIGDEGIDVNGVPVAADALGREVGTLITGDPEARVLIQPASEVPLQRIVTVVDQLALAGITNVRLLGD